jgi:transglutaminase/protease-like cytokinesis protein 3
MLMLKHFGLLILFLTSLQLLATQAEPDWKQIEAIFQKENSKFNSINALADFINKHFPEEKEAAAAIYWWLGNNITYDVQAYRQAGNTRNESPQTIIERTFKQRKGVCEGYAGIMDSVLRLLHIPSFSIGGYTRQGEIISPVPHAWVAAKIDQKWMLFDPTWAAGSLVGKRFETRFDPGFFLVEPEQMRLTHMPYDPIWQFSERPLSHQDFIHSKFQKTDLMEVFAYADSITAYENLDQNAKMLAEYHRILRYYYPHKAINNRLDFLSQNLEIARYNQEVDLLNQATTSYNQAATSYNEWVDWHQQNGPRHSETSDRLLLDSGKNLANSLGLLQHLQQASPELSKGVRSLDKAVNSLKKQLEKEGLKFE